VIGGGYNNLGVIDESSTFISQNLLQALAVPGVEPGDLSFFIEHFNDVDLSDLLETKDETALWETGRTLRAVFRLWSERPERIDPPEIEWAGAHSLRAGGERLRELSDAVAFLYVLDTDQKDDYRRWLPRIWKAYVHNFAALAGDALAGYEPAPDPARLRKCSEFAPVLGNVLAGHFLGEKSPVPAIEMEKIDRHFIKDVTADLRYDPRRRLYYFAETAREVARYNKDLTPSENIAVLIKTYNNTLESSGMDEKVIENCTFDPSQVPSFASGSVLLIEAWAANMYKKHEPVEEVENGAEDVQEGTEQEVPAATDTIVPIR